MASTWETYAISLTNTCHILACYGSNSTQAELMDIAMRSVLLVPFFVISLQSEILNFKKQIINIMNQNNTVAQNGQITTNTGEIILYQPDNSIRLEVRMEEETVWLTQAQMAMLFGTQRAAITKHLNNIYQSGEIDMETTCSKMEHVGQNGSRLYTTKYYNLDAILSVGYRVNSKNATTFRRWATHVLKDYLLRGFSINQRVQIMEERIDRQLLDHSVLLMLSKRAEGATAEIVTRRISETLTLDIERHNRQYPPISVWECDRFHDRFLIIDDTVYHLGASLKDLGKKLFAFSRMEMTAEEVLP